MIVLPPSIDSKHREFARFLLDQPRDAIEIFAALASRHFAPDFVDARARRLHRAVDIMRIRLRDFRQVRFRRRIDRREISTRMRRAKFAVDEELIARLDLDVIALLGRGRIGPAFAEIQPAFVRREQAAVCCERFRLADNDRGLLRLETSSAPSNACIRFGHRTMHFKNSM